MPDQQTGTALPDPAPPHRRDPDRSGSSMAAVGAGAAVVMIVCCAGPALIAAGVLAGVGAWLSNPWVIAAAVVVLVAAVTAVARRRRSGRAACCPRTGRPEDPTDRVRPYAPADQEGHRSR